MEISVYQVHNIVARYLSLRRCVYVVSDWLVFFCSFLCCQCAEYLAQGMPTESLSEASIATYEMNPRKVEVDTGLLCGVKTKSQHIIIDFEAKPESNVLKCTELWSLVHSSKDLDMAVPDRKCESGLIKLTDSTVPNIKQAVNERKDDYPAVHSIKRSEEQHQVNASFTK